MKRLTEYTIPETGFSVVSEEKYKRIMMDEKPSVEKVYNRLKKIEDILGDEYDLDHLRELVKADRGKRCVVLPCEAGHEISYKSSIGLRCNAVIDEYTSENIFITAKTDIPNAEPLRQTFSLSEIEAALRREQE